jgi:hypothetical protein
MQVQPAHCSPRLDLYIKLSIFRTSEPILQVTSLPIQIFNLPLYNPIAAAKLDRVSLGASESISEVAYIGFYRPASFTFRHLNRSPIVPKMHQTRVEKYTSKAHGCVVESRCLRIAFPHTRLCKDHQAANNLPSSCQLMAPPPSFPLNLRHNS